MTQSATDTQLPPDKKILELFRSTIHECTVDLFEGRGLALKTAEDAADEVENSLVSVLGFNGKKIRGTLVLQMDSDLVLASAHKQVLEAAPVDQVNLLFDWICELNNQLLGRVHNRVGMHGIKIYMATPTALSGAHLRLAQPRTGNFELMDYNSEDGQLLRVMVDLLIQDGLEVQPAVEREAPNEGDSLIF